MERIAYRKTRRGSECSYRSCERVLFVVGIDRGIEKDRRLTGLVKLVLKILQEVESWWYTVGSWMQKMQVENRDSHLAETDPESKDTNLVDKKVDVPG